MKTTPTITPTDLDCAYMAGIIDGEGSIMGYVDSRTRAVSVRIVIANTSMPLMNWIADRWSGDVMQRAPQKPEHKLVWNFRVISMAETLRVLEDVLPYLVVKLPQAELAEELFRTRRRLGRDPYVYPPEVKARRIALAEQIQQLNLKGSRPRKLHTYDPADGTQRARTAARRARREQAAVRGGGPAQRPDAASGQR